MPNMLGAMNQHGLLAPSPVDPSYKDEDEDEDEDAGDMVIW